VGTFSTAVNLTERTITAARPAGKLSGGHPAAKFYLDTKLRGFGLAVSASGVKSFFVMRRVRGKKERHVFGRATELTAAEARARAEKLLPQMTDGVSLNEKRRRDRAEAKRVEVRGVTLRQAVDLYEGTLKAKGKAPRTIEDYRYLVEKYLEAWLDRPLAELTREEVRKRHVNIASEIARGKHGRKRRDAGAGTLTANHVMRAFRAIYNRAIREHPELPANPIINVDWNQERRRTGRIPEAGLKDWYDRVQAQKNPVRRDCLLFTLFSGLRKENAAEPKWEQVDWERRKLHIPKPKSQKPFDLPLSDFLIDLLKGRLEENKKLAPGSPWVFPAARGDGHIVETRAEGGAERVAGKATGTKEPRYTPHDLRRTFISVAESLGISREARQLLVNHATPKSDVHGGYVVPELDALRGHMQTIAARLLALCVPPTKTTVVSMKRSKGAR
jgi:integrase